MNNEQKSRAAALHRDESAQFRQANASNCSFHSIYLKRARSLVESLTMKKKAASTDLQPLLPILPD